MNRLELEALIREELQLQISMVTEDLNVDRDAEDIDDLYMKNTGIDMKKIRKQGAEQKRKKAAKGQSALTKGLNSVFGAIDKGAEKLMKKAIDAAVGKIFDTYVKNSKKEAEKEAARKAKKEKKQFDWADFESEFEPDDAARIAADQFVKTSYAPLAQDMKKCIDLGKQKKQQGADFTMSGKKTCAPSGKWGEIGKELEKVKPSYGALSQQFKQDGVDDDVADIMAKPPKVQNKFDQLAQKRQKARGKRKAELEKSKPKYKEYYQESKNSYEVIMEGWRRFSDEGES